MNEILRIMVRLKETMEVTGKTGCARMIAFTGEAEGPYFQGKILPHGVDTQKVMKGKSLQLSARYMLEGVDANGTPCRLFIENNGEETSDGLRTSPRIYTDSEALSWLEETCLTGSVEGCGENQVLIRIRKADPGRKEKQMYRTEVHSVRVRDDRIFATAYIPDGTGPFPAVILSHGYNGKGSDFCKEAAFFAEHGIVACTFDFCGGSVHSDSSMDTRRMSVLTEKEDLEAMISFVKARREVAAGQLFLLGGSQGGFVTTLAAAERPDGIRGLILYYPAFCIPDDWRKEYPDPAKIPESREFWGMELGKAYFSAVLQMDAYAALGNIGQKVLLLHGDKDTVVPLACARKATQIGKQVELEILPEEGHGFTDAGAKTAMERALAFMQAELNQ